jgi:hypothetical protein
MRSLRNFVRFQIAELMGEYCVTRILRSLTKHENANHRRAGMDGRHPGRKDASEDIHVNLDSSAPCWNDAMRGSGETDQGVCAP